MADDKVRPSETAERSDAAQKPAGGDPKARGERSVRRTSSGRLILGISISEGFFAGYVVAKLRSSAILGVLLGTVTGIYAAQSYQVPNIERTVKDYMNNLKKGPK
ncbi:hypothetical protein E3U43_001408 [Larimichthys crocea]|uniref:Uncharacterized protein n=1 Tax=Larimichthys crocea TaxID=215358 RepID=A0ACD3RCY2_LARCR|nr:hypothetical protein E3U43_001408 [Larimichthys crocea]